MKHSTSIKNLLTIASLLLAIGWTSNLRAFTYTNSNLMLVFREGAPFNDVEFNIGSISNFLGKPNGMVIPVTNWDLSLVKAQFNNNLTTVKYALIAVTEASDSTKRTWLTDASTGDTPTDITGSKWTQLYSKITTIGAYAAAATATNPSPVFVTNTTDTSSYTYITSNGDPVSGDTSTISGTAPFPIELSIPSTNKFVELKTSSLIPKPASTILGTFAMQADGTLTFTAGHPIVITASHIQGITRAGNVNSVTFTTVSGQTYRLRYSSTPVPANISGWTTLPTTVSGDGSNKTLTDTDSSGKRFYAVETF